MTKKTDTELATVDMGALQVAGLGANTQLMDELIQESTYLSRIQLYSKGKPIDTGLISPGHFGTPNNDEIKSLGTEIDIIPLCVRAKAIDSSDRDAMVITYDAEGEEYARIKSLADVKDSGCQFGFAYLVYERSTSEYYEYFFGNESHRRAAPDVTAFLPKTSQRIKELTEKLGHAPQPAGPCTLKSKYVIKKGTDWGWFVPTTYPCSTPFKGFDLVQANEQIAKFEALEGSKVEKAPEDDNSRAR